MTRDSLKDIISATKWISIFDEDFELQNDNGALCAFFSVNVDKDSNWQNIPQSILKDGCIDFLIDNEWHDYQFIDEAIDINKATCCRWIITILRSSH